MNRQLNRLRPFAATLAVALLSAGAFAQPADEPTEQPAENQVAPASGPLVPTPPRPGPRIRAGSKGEVVFYDNDVDLGNVLDTEKPTAEFRFKSIGPGPITLRNIKPDCGCTLARLWRITTDDEGNEVREEIDPANLPRNGTFEEGRRGHHRGDLRRHQAPGRQPPHHPDLDRQREAADRRGPSSR